jgi:hypothetical protein
MRYLLLIAITVIISGYKLKDRTQKHDNKIVIRIFPDEKDTSTFLNQVITTDSTYGRVFEIFNVHGRRIRHLEISRSDRGYYVEEFLTDKSKFSKDDTFADFYPHSFYSQYVVQQFTESTFIINDSLRLEVAYKSNGQIESYTRIKKTFPDFDEWHAEWDSSYNHKWAGAFIETSEEKGTVIINHENVKSGWWKEYNTMNEVVDSIYYPDPKH